MNYTKNFAFEHFWLFWNRFQALLTYAITLADHVVKG